MEDDSPMKTIRLSKDRVRAHLLRMNSLLKSKLVGRRPGGSSRLAGNAPGLLSLGLTREQQAGRILRMADTDALATADLSARHEIRQRVAEQAFDRTFERPRPVANVRALRDRSEERRVGKEGRSRWSPPH